MKIRFKTFTLIACLASVIAFVQARAQSDPQDTWLETKSYNQNLYMPDLNDPDAIEKTYESTDGLPEIHSQNITTQDYFNSDVPELPTKKEPPSALESLYTQRAEQPLKQFGYDLFKTTKKSQKSAVGGVQDSYILGSYDTLRISFSGQKTDTYIYKIDSSGQLLIKDFPPILAAGQTLGELKKTLATETQKLHNTQIHVALTEVRQIDVLVIGNVINPGLKHLSAFDTIINALSESGGIRKDGSLRQIKLVRNGKSNTIDLYGLLMDQNTSLDLLLRDGDRLIIPPIGPTLAISGDVKRPGIYEIRRTYGGGSEKLNLKNTLSMAGGIISPGQNRFIHLSVDKNGKESVNEVLSPTPPLLSDGSILNVARGGEQRTGMVELTGHTRKPGLHDLGKNKTLSKIIDTQQALGSDIYPLIGVIERKNSALMTTRYISFPVRQVITREHDQMLEEGDIIHLFSNEEILNLTKKGNVEPTQTLKISKQNQRSNTQDSISPDLSAYLQEQMIFLRGAVRAPGSYPIAAGETLESVLATGGGPTREADTTNIEITSLLPNHDAYNTVQSGKLRQTINLTETHPAHIEVSPGDAIRINQKYQSLAEKTVIITGEVMTPGRYDLLPGDKVSDLLERAGGLSPQAYPSGAIFSRESERKSEEMRFRVAAQEMERSLAAAIQREKNPPGAAQIEMVRGLAAELASVEAVGRITVETDPAILEIHPELDMLLESGDRIYIPKRPLTVRVSGEVLSPASLQFRSGKDPLDYIHQAGGFTYHADKDRTFVLYPDGSAQPLRVNTWNHKPALIPPGSTIVVPRDPKPFDFIESARDISQILSNLAITSIFIDDLRD